MEPLPVCAKCEKFKNAMKICTRCRLVYYCGRDCQITDWARHKVTCNSNLQLQQVNNGIQQVNQEVQQVNHGIQHGNTEEVIGGEQNNQQDNQVMIHGIETNVTPGRIDIQNEQTNLSKTQARVSETNDKCKPSLNVPDLSHTENVKN
ncbi:unnamed protein product, partial [Owenia fusiformis]